MTQGGPDRTHAVITGGGSGIGLAIARRMATAGYRLTLMGRRQERVEAAAAELPEAHPIAVDVTSEESVRDGFAKAAEIAPITVLINNAGAELAAPLQRTSLSQWHAMLAVNLTGVYLCTRQVVPGMVERKYGRIVTVASTAGLRGYAYTTAYTAAKHGAVGFTRALALELSRSGVTVNCVCPGFTDTDLVSRSLENISQRTGRNVEEAQKELERFNPQGRLVDPDEVAAAVVWLISADSTALTGQAISVSGGEVM